MPLLLAALVAGCGYGPAGPEQLPEQPAAPAPTTPEDAGQVEPDAAPPEPPALPALEVADPLWFDLAAVLVDRDLLAAGFAKRKYEPPEGAHALAARIVAGRDQPAFAYLSLGDTGFVSSDGNFWPASSVKLLAAVGALETLQRHGLTGDAKLTFEDHRGIFHKRAERLYCAALTWSSNLAYDRLIRVAGLDEINHKTLTEARGFHYAAFGRAFASGEDGAPLYESPEIGYVEGEQKGAIPARSGSGKVERCPEGDNCAALFELLDPLSRVVLHKELPESERFDIAPIDVRRLKAFLIQSKCGFTEAAEQVFGDDVRIYNKRGYSPSFDMIDHALIVDRRTGRRYLLAASVRYKDRDKDLAKAELAELGRHALEVLRRHEPEGPLLQRNAGVEIDVAVEVVSQTEATFEVSVPDGVEIDRLELIRGRELVGDSVGPCLESTVPVPATQEIYVVQAHQGGELAGYRAAAVTRTNSD
jgi:hypothetical protein